GWQRCRSRREARGKTATSNRSIAGSETSFWRLRSSRRCRKRKKKEPGFAASTIGCGRTVRWLTRRPRCSVTNVTEVCTDSLRRPNTTTHQPTSMGLPFRVDQKTGSRPERFALEEVFVSYHFFGDHSDGEL